jgi:hypothetical protein
VESVAVLGDGSETPFYNATLCTLNLIICPADLTVRQNQGLPSQPRHSVYVGCLERALSFPWRNGMAYLRILRW